MGYDAKTERLIALKKLAGKAQTSNDKGLANEGLPSGLTVSSETAFGEPISTSPSDASLYDITGIGEYVRFESTFIAGSDTSSGRHGFELKLPADYESNSSNPLAGVYPFINGQSVNITSGVLQLIPPAFATTYEGKPFYGGTSAKDTGTQIPLLDARDWYLDYFNGVFFQQDPPGAGDHANNPDYLQGFLYIGEMLNTVVKNSGSAGGGGGTGVGWIGRSPGQIDTTGSVGITGSLSILQTINRIGEVGNKIDFQSGQVLILSGGAAVSPDEAAGTDVTFFVSGTVGAKDTSVQGTSVFGGDMMVSGTLVANGPGAGAYSAVKIDKDYTGTTSVGNLVNDASGLLVDYDVTGVVATGQTAYHDAIAVNYNQDGAVHVGTVNATGADIRMTGGTDGTQTMKGVAVRLAGADNNIGLDVEVPDGDTHFIARSSANLSDSFQISVTTDAVTTLSTVGGGDGDLTLDVDGKIMIEALAGDEVVFNDGGNNVDFRAATLNRTHAIFADASTDQVLILSGGAATDPNERLYPDLAFFVSGAVGSRSTSTRGTALFGGDMVASGTISSLSGLTGSLTRIDADTTYLAAGSGIDIISASNGQVTVASSFGTLVRKKTVYEVTQSHASEAPLIITGNNFSDGDYDPNLIDVFLNGQLLTSGTSVQVSAGTADYTVVSPTSVKFGFGLESDDVVTPVIINNSA